jgi:hypothetical protein
MCVDAESLGLILDVINIFNVMTACSSNLSHRCIGNDLSVEQSPAIKWSLNDMIALSAAFRLWMYGGTDYDVMFC